MNNSSINPERQFNQHGFKIIEQLGINYSGGRVVYLARQIDTERLVAIKEFQFTLSGASWDGHKAIQREIDILKQLQHPNIPRYLSSFETELGFCLVQEYIDGKPLSDLISKQQLYSTEQIRNIIFGLLSILDYLQTSFAEPIYHRDIKPANILIDKNLQPHLIDFGGAKIETSHTGGSTVATGTLGFMAPEQRFDRFDRTTDLYSLGLTIICWLTRTEPTEMFEMINIANNRVENLDRKLSNFSPNFIRWIEVLVEPVPAHRYPTPKVAIDKLAKCSIDRLPAIVRVTEDNQLSITNEELNIIVQKSEIGQNIHRKFMLEEYLLDSPKVGSWQLLDRESNYFFESIEIDNEYKILLVSISPVFLHEVTTKRTFIISLKNDITGQIVNLDLSIKIQPQFNLAYIKINALRIGLLAQIPLSMVLYALCQPVLAIVSTPLILLVIIKAMYAAIENRDDIQSMVNPLTQIMLMTIALTIEPLTGVRIITPVMLASLSVLYLSRSFTKLNKY